MKPTTTFVQRNGRRIAALAAVTGIYWAAQLPQLSPEARTELAGRYHLVGHALPELPGYPMRTVRNVHPSLHKICAWISSVGAAVAMNDLDGDGLPNDVAYVDPRTDLVVVTPAPGTPARYGAFALNAAPLPYDSSNTAPMGAAPGDFNEDGRMDVLVYYWGRTPVIFLQRADAVAPLSAASYQPVEVAPTKERWFTNAVAVDDIDGDGHLDIVIGNYFQDGANILDAKGSGTEAMQHSMSQALNGGHNRLLLWTPSAAGQGVAFTEARGVFPSEIADGWTLACGACDLDGDMKPEIYFANDFGPDRLLYNRSTPGHPSFSLLEGERTLLSPKSKVLGHDSFKGMGVDFADVNGDGYPDIYVSNIAGEYALEESHFVWVSTGEVGKMKEGIAPYVDQSEGLGLSRSSWGWDTRWCDLNNDGRYEAMQATGFVKGTRSRWPELHELATANDNLLDDPRWWMSCRPGDELCGHEHVRFYAYDAAQKHYFDIAGDVGIGRMGVSRGIATADVDGDGLMDLAVANQWDTSFYYHNESKGAGGFVGLHLRLPVAGGGTEASVVPGNPVASLATSPAIGAHVVLHLPDGRALASQVDGGSGHSGKRSPDIHFGIGSVPAETPLKADVRWRDRGGRVHTATITVRPGWHTVVLGSSQASGVLS